MNNIMSFRITTLHHHHQNLKAFTKFWGNNIILFSPFSIDKGNAQLNQQLRSILFVCLQLHNNLGSQIGYVGTKGKLGLWGRFRI